MAWIGLDPMKRYKAFLFYLKLLVIFKPLQIMAKVKILFYGTERSETELSELEVFANVHNEIFISIENHDYPASFICLDKLTAARLVRELKKQIGLLLESEANNG